MGCKKISIWAQEKPTLKVVYGARLWAKKRGAGRYYFGFNSKEKDTEGEWGTQTHYDYGFRIYNPAIGKFLSVDPLMKEYPMLTPYQFASNTPIVAIDLDGLEGVQYDIVTKNKKGKTRIRTVIQFDLYIAVGKNKTTTSFTKEEVPEIVKTIKRQFNGRKNHGRKVEKGHVVQVAFTIHTFDVDAVPALDKARKLHSETVIANDVLTGKPKLTRKAVVLTKVDKVKGGAEGGTMGNLISISKNAVNRAHTIVHEIGHFFLWGSSKNPNTAKQHDAAGGVFFYKKVDPSGEVIEPTRSLNKSNLKLFLDNIPKKVIK